MTDLSKVEDSSIAAMKPWDFWSRESLVLEPGELSVEDCSPERRQYIQQQMRAWREQLISAQALGLRAHPC